MHQRRSSIGAFQLLVPSNFWSLIRNILSVEELAKKKNVSMAQISIAWLLQQDPVAAPIVGTTSLENLHDILG